MLGDGLHFNHDFFRDRTAFLKKQIHLAERRLQAMPQERGSSSAIIERGYGFFVNPHFMMVPGRDIP